MADGVLYGINDETARFLGHVPSTVNSVYQPPTGLDTADNTLGAHTLVDFVIEDLDLSGEMLTSFFDDWYYRIHVVPQRLDLSNVVSDQTRQVYVWNGYLDSKLLSSASYPTDGVTVTDNYGTPYNIGPLEQLIYDVQIEAEGPPVITGAIQWTIGGVVYEVPLSGQRIVVWPFGPNWTQPLVESLDWLTDVFTAFNGNEQRRELRSKPRRMFEYTAWVKGNDAAVMRNLLWGWQARNYALPLWHDRTQLSSQVLSGASSISVDTAYRGFFPGGLAVLLKDALDYEVVEVATVASGTITVAKPLERAWPAGTPVYPVNVSRLPASVTSRVLTDSVHEVTLTFSADPLQTDPYIPSIAATETHGGYEVVFRKPNWAVPVTFESQFDRIEIDFGTGGVTVDQSREWPMDLRKFQWVFKTKQDAHEFRGLLGRLRGRLKPVLMPTWFSDFELHAPANAAAVSIQVRHNAFANMVGQNAALNHLMIWVEGQPPVIRTIGTVGSDPAGYTVLGLNAAIGVELNENTVKRLSLVHLCRLASDRVTINYLSDSVSTVEATFALVKA